jgi:hypothetical protein
MDRIACGAHFDMTREDRVCLLRGYEPPVFEVNCHCVLCTFSDMRLYIVSSTGLTSRRRFHTMIDHRHCVIIRSPRVLR